MSEGGVICTVNEVREFGFIRVAGERDRYFRKADMAPSLAKMFGKSLVGMRVVFGFAHGELGPRAVDVRLA